MPVVHTNVYGNGQSGLCIGTFAAMLKTGLFLSVHTYMQRLVAVRAMLPGKGAVG